MQHRRGSGGHQGPSRDRCFLRGTGRAEAVARYASEAEGETPGRVLVGQAGYPLGPLSLELGNFQAAAPHWWGMLQLANARLRAHFSFLSAFVGGPLSGHSVLG